MDRGNSIFNLVAKGDRSNIRPGRDRAAFAGNFRVFKGANMGKVLKATFGRRGLAMAAAAVAIWTVAPAMGALVYINSSQATINSSLSTAGNARYLLSQNNYDQNIQAGGGSVTGNNISVHHIGGVSALSGRQFTFSLENRAGQGLLFNLSAPATSSRSAVNSTLAWGVFSPNITGQSPTIGGFAPGESFNVLSLAARADRERASMSVSELIFTSPNALVADGAFANGTAVPSSLTTVGTFTQTLVSDTNLAGIDWMLTGKLTGIRDISASGEASVAFQINLINASVSAPVVPEPSTVAMSLMVAIPLLLRRRR